MTQATNLIQKAPGDGTYSLKVGAADIIPYRLYTLDADNLLVIAGDNESGPLFFPLTAEKVGRGVAAWLFGSGGSSAVKVQVSGAVAIHVKLTCAANGMVKTAAAGDYVIGTSYVAAADAEVVSVIAGAPYLGA